MDPYNRERRHTMQRHVIEYLREHPCVDCGETDPIVLEFDHLRDKIANVSAMALAKRPWRVILAEIEKCEVVCANCHRRRTLARSGAFRWTFGMGAAST
jgi:L-lysine 2,3-aminomutase